ncbi:hypothetical protein J8V43_19335, partial [Photorhabdus laumondii]
TKLSIACSPLGAVFGAHQNFAPGTGFSSISYPEFGLIILHTCVIIGDEYLHSSSEFLTCWGG